MSHVENKSGSSSNTYMDENGNNINSQLQKGTGKDESKVHDRNDGGIEATHDERPLQGRKKSWFDKNLRGYASDRRDDGKIELKEEDCYEHLGFSFSTFKKWTILTVIFVVQSSMNFNASVYPNAVGKPGKDGITKQFGISEQAARVGQMIFLVSYAFGCELWAPWSEEFGRRPILQLSLGLVNIWQIPCALAPNFGTIVVGRFLGGISSAGGSVTLGMVADIFEPDNQQFAVAYIVLASVGGSVIGPIFGGLIEAYLSWRWVFWICLIFGGATQALHFVLVPETRVTILLDKEAKRRRENGEKDVYGPNELKKPRISAKEVLTLWYRPFEMFAREPIVLCLSLLSGFSDALIFTFLEAYQPVFKQWGFGTVALGLAFIPVGIGYFIAWFSFMPFFARDNRIRRQDPDALPPERRLFWLLFTAPLETIGLFIFAWTSLGPPIPWIAPLIASTLVGIANYAIYMATIDYMVAAYGPYSASATGGNGLSRDFLAGIAAMYSTPFYEHWKKSRYELEYPTTILACLAALLTVPIYIFYFKGAWFREKSTFAQTLASDRRQKQGRRASKAPGA